MGCCKLLSSSSSALVLLAVANAAWAQVICNPLPIPYRFQLTEPSRREAADPTMFVYNKSYWLFTSKNGGYYHSADMATWTLIEPTGLPLEDYAPTVMDGGDGLVYFTAVASKAVYATADLMGGNWIRVATLESYGDPCLFRDDDGAIYMASGAYGAGAAAATTVVRLDTASPNGTWAEVATQKNPHAASGNYTAYGWEERGDDNNGDAHEPGQFDPSIEGSWLNKGPDGRYYLQYAAPGTQYKTYGDGVFVADHVLGPYERARYSPFSFKPTGFSAAAGHSSTFQDLRGNWWHISTSTISMRHKFERRLSLFPAAFVTAPGGGMELRVETSFGDYPLDLSAAHGAQTGAFHRPAWQLLSLRKRVSASSTLRTQAQPQPQPYRCGDRAAAGPCCGACDAAHAVDEDIRTWWSAATRSVGEWLAVDLGVPCTVRGVQINFADQGSVQLGRLPQNASGAYRFVVESSNATLISDGAVDDWAVVPALDRRRNTRDMPHDFVALPQPLVVQHLRVRSTATPPGGALFSISGFRVFGDAPGGARRPAAVAEPNVIRNASDPRRAHVSWTPAARAQFYIVRYGIVDAEGAHAKAGVPITTDTAALTYAYHVHNGTEVQINALAREQRYAFAIDAVNEVGITPSTVYILHESHMM